MNNRQYMIDFRSKHQIDLARMAKVCDCSEALLEMIETDARCVTHPNIAKRIAGVYKLTPEQAENLLPENRRPSSSKYEPGRYVIQGEFIHQLGEPVV